MRGTGLRPERDPEKVFEAWQQERVDEHGLYPAGTPADLSMLGHSWETVLERTGVDVGYNAARLKSLTMNRDRLAYRCEHVRQRVSPTELDELLARYGRSEVDRDGFLGELGLGLIASLKIKDVMAGISMADEFGEIDRVRRRADMARGAKEAFGVENVFELSQFQEQAADTREQRYGARYTLAAGSSLSEGARQKFKDRMADPEAAEEFYRGRTRSRRENRAAELGVELREDGTLPPMRGPALPPKGVLNPGRGPGYRDPDPDVAQARLDRSRRTTTERYGVDHASKRLESREVARSRGLEHGGDWAQKAKDTNLDRYGVAFWAPTPEGRAAASARMSDPDHQARLHEARVRNGTQRSSSAEERLGAMLRSFFGSDDVLDQHRDPRYPFACDFYVPSRDLFIELNGSWTHGGHWYDPASATDVELVRSWEDKALSVSRFYDPVTWTRRDVAKRAAAAEHELNYVVLWDGCRLGDAMLWIAMGCPDGRDWEREYSWLPERALDLGGDQWPQLSAAPRRATAIARRANWRTFYARELALWEADGTSSRRWGRTRGRLYANRLEHMGAQRGTGKLPDQLSDLEILRGLGISGAVRAYSVFDNSGMRAVIEAHAPRSIYDPCAGWGERLVTAAAHGVAYTASDVNDAVVAGHREIIAAYGLSGVRSEVADAGTRDMRGHDHDMVFTCPPYGDQEVYSAAGAENLDEQAFLGWWAQVVAMSTGHGTTVFAYQVNQRLKAAMNAVVEAAGLGWRLHDTVALGSQSSHFTRKGGVNSKREYEEVQVFVK